MTTTRRWRLHHQPAPVGRVLALGDPRVHPIVAVTTARSASGKKNHLARLEFVRHQAGQDVAARQEHRALPAVTKGMPVDNWLKTISFCGAVMQRTARNRPGQSSSSHPIYRSIPQPRFVLAGGGWRRRLLSAFVPARSDSTKAPGACDSTAREIRFPDCRAAIAQPAGVIITRPSPWRGSLRFCTGSHKPGPNASAGSEGFWPRHASGCPTATPPGNPRAPKPPTGRGAGTPADASAAAKTAAHRALTRVTFGWS